MTAADRRLVALAAVFVPSRARQVLSRLGAPGAGETVAAAGSLSAAGRQVRLRALSVAVPPDPGTGPAGAWADAERSRIARILHALAAGTIPPGPPPSPIVLRLCRARLSLQRSR